MGYTEYKFGNIINSTPSNANAINYNDTETVSDIIQSMYTNITNIDIRLDDIDTSISTINNTLSNKADITDLKGIVKSKNISITTNGYGQFVGTIGANNKYYIIGVKEPTGGIVNYSYNDGTYKIAGYVYNWAGAVVASKTFTLTVYYLDLN